MQSSLSLLALPAFAALLCATRADRYHPAAEPDDIGPTTRNSAEAESSFWADEAQAAIGVRLERAAADSKARNVVMFLGDGMSVPTLAAARTLLGQRRGATGEEAQLAFESFPSAGLIKTYCVNAQVADSACTATAYLCGAKANQGTIGVSAAVTRGDCEASTETARRVESITEWALASGRDVGIVTTTRVTHASPAGAFAKVADRNWENDALVEESGHTTDRCPDITHQLVHMHPGNKFKVILGGGRRNFLPNTMRDEEGTLGRRTDARNLIEEWQNQKASLNVSYEYVWHRQQLKNISDDLPEYLLGLFEGNHMQYNMQGDPESEPTLTDLTEVAIRMLSRNEKGFFLFVEGGRIDHAHHANQAELALDETIAMSDAVKRATELLAEEDSLVVVTADHAHVMAFNGYSLRGRDILGTSRSVDRDRVPYMTLSYTNGPGARAQVNGIRPDVTTEQDFRTLQWATHADVPLASETHGGDDVAVFAWGPHHTMFSGLYEQSQLPHLMGYAACMGPGRHACNAAQSLAPLSALFAALLLALALHRRF